MKEVDDLTLLYEKKVKEVEVLQIKLSESSNLVEMTPANIVNAGAQGISETMFQAKTNIILLVLNRKDMSSPDVNNLLQPVDFFEGEIKRLQSIEKNVIAPVMGEMLKWVTGSLYSASSRAPYVCHVVPRPVSSRVSHAVLFSCAM